MAGWLSRHQQTVIDSLIAENRVLKGQLEGQRIRLAIKAKVLGRRALDEPETLVTPDALLAWHRKLIAQKWTYARQGPGRPGGRPRVSQEITELVLRMARENTSWGYDRTQGALANLGHIVATNTVKNILKRHGIEPAAGFHRPAGRPGAQASCQPDTLSRCVCPQQQTPCGADPGQAGEGEQTQGRRGGPRANPCRATGMVQASRSTGSRSHLLDELDAPKVGPWRVRRKRVFNIDIETCRECGGAVRIVACIDDPYMVVIEKILTHLDEKGASAEVSRQPRCRLA